jgi:hypothetical protein
MRVLIFARDPGGANAVVPLVRSLVDRGHGVRLAGKDAALRIYRRHSLEAIDIASLSPALTPQSIRQFLIQGSPSVVITGTSADDSTEKIIWSECCNLRIPSMAIVDQWLNYGIRFSPFGVNEMSEYLQQPDLCHLPDIIVAPDEYAREEMIREGLPKERIRAWGQPYFETVMQQGQATGPEKTDSSGTEYSDAFTVLFASEPISTTYGSEQALRHWGYTEKTILSSLIDALERVAPESPRTITLLIRPHPKEGSEHFQDLIQRCRRIRCDIDRSVSQWSAMRAADLVCGMSSMFLIESVLLGRQVISIQTGLTRENPFILDRRGILRSVLCDTDLYERLRRSIVEGAAETASFGIIPHAAERIITEMEKLPCRNWP